MIHELKILPEHFDPVVAGIKLAEVRYNDRHFSVGDYLKLMEYEPETGFTGKIVVRQVIHIADLNSWRAGFVLLSMRGID